MGEVEEIRGCGGFLKRGSEGGEEGTTEER